MIDRIAFVYCWATMGGVERVLLNRAEAFNIGGRDILMDVHFLYDSGGLSYFKKCIKELGLEQRIRVVNKLVPSDYARIFVIDTPDYISKNLNYRHRMFVECHSGYAENRTYLRSLPDGLLGLIAPSTHFAKILAEESPRFKNKVYVLQNVLPSFPELQHPINPLPWNKGFLLYLGRIDRLKNVSGILHGCASILRHTGQNIILVTVGHEVDPGNLRNEAVRLGIDGNIVILPPVPFHNVSHFLSAAADSGGIFVSASKAESFGLSVAEGLSYGMPLILSDIPAHRAFLDAGGIFLFKNGDNKSFANAVAQASKYVPDNQRYEFWKSNLSPKNFLNDWDSLASVSI